MRRLLLTPLLALALGPASAAAAEPVGSGALVVKAGKWRTLEKRGIVLAGAGAAESEGRRTRLQIAGGTIGDGVADLRLGGRLRLLAGEGRGRRVVALTGLRAALGPTSTLSARLGKRRRAIFDLVGGTLSTVAARGSARLDGARLAWRPGALRAVEARLGARLPGGALGSFSVVAATVMPAPESGPISDEPPLRSRPATAIDVKSATLTWYVRDSWIRYVSSEEAPQALEGAAARPPIEEDDHPCPDRPSGANPTLAYAFDFPFAHGWFDPAGGGAALYHGGGVRFSYPERGIDLTTRNPEIEIDGAASRAVFRLRGAGETAYPDKRAAIFSLASMTLAEGPPGTFAPPAPARATLTADGQSVFAGFYPPPGDGFGCFAVAFST